MAPALSVASFRRHAVQFAAIAGGEDQRLRENAARTQLLGGLARLFGRERDALAQLDRGGAVIQSDENNFHLLQSLARLPRYPCSRSPHQKNR